MEEMKNHHYSCAAEQAELLCQLDAAVAMGKASLHDCRQGGRATADNKRLRLQQIQAGERERHMARRLDVVLHTNHSLQRQIASLRDNVLRDRDHCNCLLQRHTAIVEASAQYTNSLRLENETRLLIRSIKQKVDSTTKSSQHTTQQMLGHRVSLDKIAGAKALDGCETNHNSKQPRSRMKETLQELAVTVPSGRLLEVVQTVLKMQRRCISLFHEVHQLDGDLQSASERESNTKS